MIPQSQKRTKRNSSKVNLMMSIGFHALVVLGLLYLAAQSETGQKLLKKLGVTIVKKEPEKPKPPEKPPEPPKEVPKVATVKPTITETPKENRPQATAVAPAAAAPAAAEMPAFSFNDGAKAVESDPVQVYKSMVEYALNSRWDRPENMADHDFVAEVEVAIDATGRISDPVWKKSSGDTHWDDTVRQALAKTTKVDKAPPANFPPRVVVKFDVQEIESIAP